VDGRSGSPRKAAERDAQGQQRDNGGREEWDGERVDVEVAGTQIDVQ
jgi:hypothetical protein